jgi:hypothetical protein
MKKLLVILLIPMLFMSFSVLISCKNKSADSSKKKLEPEQIESLKEGIRRNVYPFKNAAEVVKMLADYGVGYIPALANSPDNIKKYSTLYKQAMNLGAFGSDLSYASFYDAQQDVMKNLGAIRTLSNELNMPKIYDESLYDRLKVNASNQDSLVAILTEAFNETYYYLSENDQQIAGFLVVGGAWIEGMHLTAHVSGAAYNVTTISQAFLLQKESLNRFLEITKPYTDDPNLKEFITLLDPVIKTYSTITTGLTQKNIDDLSKAIDKVRTQMIQ